jgi:hypothetical protein
VKSLTQGLIAFLSAMVVTLVAVSTVERASPGELSTVHQREEELSGANDCSACHGGLFGTLREACLECHAPIATQLGAGTGLHGTLGARAEQCGLCHAEHHGPGAPLVHGQSFALAGVPKVAEFDHRRVGFVLDGAHAPLECSACHANARVPVLSRGEARFLGLDRDCASCHADPHDGRFAAACAACHGQTSWDELAALGHERFLALTGGHAGLACAECHAEHGPRSLEVVGGEGPRPEPRACSECHESPHSPAFAAGAAALTGLVEERACLRCHAEEHASFREPELRALPAELHAASGFALEPPHDVPACEDCHPSDGPSFEARYPGRAAERCSACHADVHGGQFATGPFAGEECSTCHAPLRFEPHAFDAAKHARAALELTGRHLEIACEDCHEEPGPARASAQPRVFRGTPSECDACHRDAHGDAFAPFVADLPAVEHGECARCHDTTRFANAAADFDHGAFTGFPVLGAHAEGGCEACHAPRARPDANGRAFGRVAELFGPFRGCETCHADPHGGRFDGGFAAEVEGRSGCTRCHVESSFRSLPRGFDHGYWTGFALEGAHAAASCAACHAPLPGASALGRTAGEAAGPRCADCHEDPHAAQFADEFGVSDCQDCHVPDLPAFLSFDHERDARFALGEAHRALECDACHETERRGALAFVRYRPLGRECTDCHGTNAGVPLRRRPRK